MTLRDRAPLAGIFIGGKARRMGGIAKGLLEVEGEPIIHRARLALEGVGAECILVGRHGAYPKLDLVVLDDDPRAQGPLAGLLALLTHAGKRPVLVIACDMPFVTSSAIADLVQATSDSAILAPRRDGHWEPFFARYDPSRVLPLAVERARRGEHGLQGLLDEAKAEVFALADDRVLVDWDTPADVPTGFTAPAGGGRKTS